MKTRPLTRTNLDKAIARLAGNDPRQTVGLRLLMANAIVAQFIGNGVVKGGTSLKFRYGETHTRYTMDLDTAWRSSLDEFLVSLRGNLESGWEGFSGEVVLLPQSSPSGVPFDYVMQPCDVKLRYIGRSWCTVRLEVGHNEIGDSDFADTVPLPPELAETFTALCLPLPQGAPLMRIPYQIAQKLHGASSISSSRSHDLIDLQLIIFNEREGIDLCEVGDICRKLFRYRKQQAWPPTISAGANWSEVYATRKGSLHVLPTIDEAIIWANDLIARIDAAK